MTRKTKIAVALAVFAGTGCGAALADTQGWPGGNPPPPAPAATGPIGPPVGSGPVTIPAGGAMTAQPSSGNPTALAAAMAVADDYGDATATVMATRSGSEIAALHDSGANMLPSDPAPAVLEVILRGDFNVPRHEPVPTGHARPHGTRLVVVVNTMNNQVADTVLAPN